MLKTNFFSHNKIWGNKSNRGHYPECPRASGPALHSLRFHIWPFSLGGDKETHNAVVA